MQQNAFSLERITSTYHMRLARPIYLLLCAAVACRAVEPMRELTVREVRLAVLDSLAQRYYCDTTHVELLYAREAWRPTHACALAGRAMALLAQAPAQEPYFVPGDTAGVRAIAVSRQQMCGYASAAALASGGRMAPLMYLIELEVRARSFSILVPLDAERLTGVVQHDIHPRGSMGPFEHLTVPTGDGPDSLATGARCGDGANAF
jgi:hypothetical protein